MKEKKLRKRKNKILPVLGRVYGGFKLNNAAPFEPLIYFARE
jgi:hypothetical protein